MSQDKPVDMSLSHVEEKAGALDVERDFSQPPSKTSAEKRVILKQDLAIVLSLAGCYFFAYLVCSGSPLSWSSPLTFYQDRGAIGNARIMGFQKDLQLSNSQFFNCLMMFCTYSF